MRTENIRGQEVEGGRAVDGLPTVLGKVVVAPVQQGVDVGHHRHLFIGADAQLRNRMGVERLRHGHLQLPLVGENLVQGLQGVIAEGQELPHALVLVALVQAGFVQ